MDHYDVIIIGSRRRRRHPRHRHPAPSGKRILLARARRLARSASPQNWDARRCSSTTATSRRTPGTTPTGSRSSRRSTTSSAARPSCTARRSTGCAAEDFGELRHHDGISPAWPISYDDIEPTTRRPSSSTRCTAQRGEDPTEPPASAPYPFPAVSHEPRDPAASATTSRPPATTRSMRRAASGSTSRDRPYSTCMRCATCDGFPCLVHAKSDAEVLGVRPALEHPNVTLLTNSRGPAPGDQRRPARRSRAWSSNATARPSSGSPATSSSSRAAPPTRPSCCSRLGERQATDGLANGPTRWGAATCSTTHGGAGASREEPNPTIFQKTLALNDFDLAQRRHRVPARRQSEMVGKSQRRDVPRRGARRRPGSCRVDAGRTAASTRSTAAVDGGPPTARRIPGANAATRRASSITTTPTNQAAEEAAHRELKSTLAKLDMDHRHLMPRHAYLRTRSRQPASRTTRTCTPSAPTPIERRCST